MNFEDIFKLAIAIITSVGGAALIMMALSSWLGKVWANRILEKDKLKYTSELEKLKTDLQNESQKQQFVFSMYFEGQFKIYNDLWLALSELQNEVDKLWESATSSNLNSFVRSIKKASKQIRNSAILIEQEHYNQIMGTIKAFEEYQIGKERLITYRNFNNINTEQLNDLVEINRDNREKISNFTDSMLQKIRKQIGGGIQTADNNANYSD